MRKPRIIFFYSRKKEENLGHELCPEANLLSLSLDQPLKKEDLDPTNGLIIIYDSTKEGKGKGKLTEIKRRFPETFQILIAKDPSKAYLMAALEGKVSQFFPLPLDKPAVLAAIAKALKHQRKFGTLRACKQWLISLKDYTWSLLGKREKLPVDPTMDDFKKWEILGIAPPNLLKFLGKESEQETNYDLYIQFFGHLNIKLRGKVIPKIRGKKNASVLAYLLFHHQKSVHRDILIDRFWSDVNTNCAKNSLNVAICSIRKDLAKVLKDQEVILYENESYCINPQLEIITDVEKFTYFWEKGRAIEAAQGLSNALHAYNKAVALYQEEFLEYLRFEDWCESERANLREIYLFILNRLSAYLFEQKNYYGCINICNKMLVTDECLEEVYRKLMKCYYALGLTDMAFKQYFKCKRVLEAELDLPPSQPTEALFESLQHGQVI